MRAQRGITLGSQRKEQKESMMGECNKDRGCKKSISGQQSSGQRQRGISIVTMHSCLLLLPAADEDTGELQFRFYERGYKRHVQWQDGLGG